MKLAVFGAGRWGPNLIRNFHQMEGVELCGIVDVNEEARKHISAVFEEVPVFSTVEEALAIAGLEAVVVATPVFTHFELVKQALDANLHVMVEKPMCATSTEINTLKKIAAKKERVLMVNHVFLYNNSIRKVKEILDEGQLGRILYFKANRTNLGPVRTDVNALWDLASHDISIFNYWLNQKPLNVRVSGISCLNEGIDDVMFATFTYADGVVGQVHASWLNPHKTRDIVIVGEEKMLLWDDLGTPQLKLYHKGINAGDQRTDSFEGHKTVVHSGEIEEPEYENNEPLKASCEHFMDCVNGKTSCLTDPNNAGQVVQVLEAADRSALAGGALIPVETGLFDD
jgi:predicted dehydrogenase